MGAKDSKLSDSKYGFDIVVAVTQASLNATMKMFLSSLNQPVVAQCYVADDEGKPQPADYEVLKKKTGGVDPFSLPATVDAGDARLEALEQQKFMMGFRAQIGLPPGLPPLEVPDVITLGSDTSAVTYTLLCAQFSVVQYTPPGGYAKAGVWKHVKQEPGKPWTFTSKVDLRMAAIDGSQFSQLPPDVQDALKGLQGEPFSVQQLLLDLNTARLQSMPEIHGVEPGTDVYRILQNAFLGAYFASMKAKGTPILGYALKAQGAPSRSTLKVTDLNLQVAPLLGPGGAAIKDPTPEQRRLATLDYLCATGGKALPPATRFGWNWVESRNEQKHGVVAVNRAALTDYFAQLLLSTAKRNCYKARTKGWGEGMSAKFDVRLFPNQEPTVVKNAAGARVLEMSYSSSDSAGVGLGDISGSVELSATYKLTVDFSATTITITQRLVVYFADKNGPSTNKGNVVDKEFTDTYHLAVSSAGDLTATLKTKEEDRSVDDRTNWFVDFIGNVNDSTSQISKWARGIAHTRLQHLPVSTIQKFVFPGGKAFTFKSVAFSDNQDLVCDITYADPTGA
jgi:hypothetical protein